MIGQNAHTASILTAGIAMLIQLTSPGYEIRVLEQPTGATVPPRLRVTAQEHERWMVVLLTDDDFSGAAAELKAGASAVITLSSSLPEFEAAVAALDGGDSPFVASPLAQGILRKTSDADSAVPKTVPRLTGRQRHVLGFVARGYTNQQIADELGISVHTVRAHMASLRVKLGGSGRARIVANARALGIPEASDLTGVARQCSP